MTGTPARPTSVSAEQDARHIATEVADRRERVARRPTDAMEAWRDVAYAMRGMKATHRAVIALRWAGDGGEPMRLCDVGAVIGRSVERVRQMEAEALDYMARRLGAWHSGARWQKANGQPIDRGTDAPSGPRTRESGADPKTE